MKLSARELKNLTTLTKISFSEEDLKKFQEQISAILTFVDQLKEVDISRAGIVKQINGVSNHWRDDKVCPAPEETKDNLVKAAPEAKGREIKVPGVFAD